VAAPVRHPRRLSGHAGARDVRDVVLHLVDARDVGREATDDLRGGRRLRVALVEELLGRHLTQVELADPDLIGRSGAAASCATATTTAAGAEAATPATSSTAAPSAKTGTG